MYWDLGKEFFGLFFRQAVHSLWNNQNWLVSETWCCQCSTFSDTNGDDSETWSWGDGLSLRWKILACSPAIIMAMQIKLRIKKWKSSFCRAKKEMNHWFAPFPNYFNSVVWTSFFPYPRNPKSELLYESKLVKHIRTKVKRDKIQN